MVITSQHTLRVPDHIHTANFSPLSKNMASLSLHALLLIATTLTMTSAQNTITSASPTQTTLATSTSLYQATRTETDYPSYATPSHLVDSAGGASGNDSGSFSLSKGGLIAIIVIVVGVAVFGIASIVLFVLAKRRQWNVRASIKRASRRLTGRDPGPKPSEIAARKKRSGMVAGTSRSRGEGPERETGQKRGVMVAVKDDVEKGPLDYGVGPTTKKPRENTWVGRLWGNNWK